jgi:hypothetical protein
VKNVLVKEKNHTNKTVRNRTRRSYPQEV